MFFFNLFWDLNDKASDYFLLKIWRTARWKVAKSTITIAYFLTDFPVCWIWTLFFAIYSSVTNAAFYNMFNFYIFTVNIMLSLKKICIFFIFKTLLLQLSLIYEKIVCIALHFIFIYISMKYYTYLCNSVETHSI